MAQLSCRCGEGMYKTDCPSEYSLFIYHYSEVEKALKENPSVTLNDFLTNWDSTHDCAKEYMSRKEPVEYWFCPSCKRVYEVQKIPHGRWLRIFKRRETDIPLLIDYSDWDLIYVMTDVETDQATEDDFEISLSEYLKYHDVVQFYMSPDKKTVCAIEKTTSRLLYLYEMEDSWSPSC